MTQIETVMKLALMVSWEPQDPKCVSGIEGHYLQTIVQRQEGMDAVVVVVVVVFGVAVVAAAE